MNLSFCFITFVILKVLGGGCGKELVIRSPVNAIYQANRRLPFERFLLPSSIMAKKR